MRKVIIISGIAVLVVAARLLGNQIFPNEGREACYSDVLYQTKSCV